MTSRGKILLILAITAIILFIRKTDAIINPQFWAEDGTIFFLQQYNQGVSSLFVPYAGYLHFVPRLISLFTDLFFPYSVAPYVYNYSSLFLTILVIANIYSSRLIIRNKSILALSVVLVPHYTNEVFLNITNLQWILALSLILTLLKESPHEKYRNLYFQIVSDFTVIICCGLTGPFVIFLSPFFVWKYFNEKSKYRISVVLAVIAATSIQIFFIAKNAHLSSEKPLVNYEIYYYAGVVGQRFFGNLFLGMKIPYKINPYILCGLLIFLIIFVVYLSVQGGKYISLLIVVFLSFSSAILIATLNKFSSNPLILIPPENGPRYFYLPHTMIVWSLIICIDQKKTWKSIVVKLLLILVLISSLISGFHSRPLINYNWQYYAKLIGREQKLLIPINPEGWHINVSQNRHYRK